MSKDKDKEKEEKYCEDRPVECTKRCGNWECKLKDKKEKKDK